VLSEVAVSAVSTQATVGGVSVCSIPAFLTGGVFSFLFTVTHKKHIFENEILEILDVALCDD